MNKSVVLLSAGLDSAVNLFMSHKVSEIVRVITFNYGQRAAVKEIEKSKELCQHLKLPHEVVDLFWLKGLGQSSLTNEMINVPKAQTALLDDAKASHQTAKAVWVPNRNGVFLNIAGSFAESLQAHEVIPGFNLEEAATFPDNSESFIDSMNRAFQYSTANGVKVKSHTIHMNKPEIMKAAVELRIPLQMLWPCYHAFEKWCGECESCQRSKRAMLANQLNIQEYFLKL